VTVQAAALLGDGDECEPAAPVSSRLARESLDLPDDVFDGVSEMSISEPSSPMVGGAEWPVGFRRSSEHVPRSCD
jgi:hypothetical protein